MTVNTTELENTRASEADVSFQVNRFNDYCISYNFDFLLIVAGNLLAVCHMLCNGAALFVLRGRSGLLGKI